MPSLMASDSTTRRGPDGLTVRLAGMPAPAVEELRRLRRQHRAVVRVVRALDAFREAGCSGAALRDVLCAGCHRIAGAPMMARLPRASGE
jgi:hypothetical protein